MKNKIAKIFSVVLAALLLFTNMSCQMNLIDDDADLYSYVTLSLNGNSRTIFPCINESSLRDIKLYKNDTTEENLVKSWNDFTTAGYDRIKMETGKVTLILTAMLGNKPVSDSVETDIVEGGNLVSFNLAVGNTVYDYENGTGSLKYTLTYPGTASYSSPVFQLKKGLSGEPAYVISTATSTTESGKTKVVFQKSDVPAGVYKFIAQVKVGDQYAYYSDIIYIANGYESEGGNECVLTESGIITRVHVKYYKDESCSQLLGEDDYWPGDRLESFNLSTDDYFHMSWGIVGDTSGGNTSVAPFSDCSVYPLMAEKIKVHFNTMDESSISDVQIPKGWWIYISTYGTRMTISGLGYAYNGQGYIEKDLPAKVGKVIEGWYTDSQCNEKYTGTSHTDDFTLYAKWIDVATINLYGDDKQKIDSINVVPGQKYYFELNNNRLKLYDEHHNVINATELTSISGKVVTGCYYVKDSDQLSALGYSNAFTAGTEGIDIYLALTDASTVTLKKNSGEVLHVFTVPKNTQFRIYNSLPRSTETYQYISLNGNNGNFGGYSYPLNAGKMLAGIYLDENCTRLASNLDMNGDMVLYAEETDSCVLSFELNGGSLENTNNNLRNSYYVPKGKNLNINLSLTWLNINVVSENNAYIASWGSDLPTKNGEDFLGWCLDSDCTSTVSSLPITGDIKLYAKYGVQEKWTISFDPETCGDISSFVVNKGNSLRVYKESSIYGFQTDNFMQLARVPVPVKAGKVFTGWYKDASLQTPVVINEYFTVTEDLTLYARFDDAYTISFDTDGGTPLSNVMVPASGYVNINSSTDIWINHRVDNQSNTPNNKIANFPFPTKEGKVFMGLFKDKAYTETVPWNMEITSDIILYVKWGDACQVKLNAMGGDLTVTTVTAPAGEKIYYKWYLQGTENYGRTTWFISSSMNAQTVYYTMVPVPTKPGKVFAGWYTDVECTKEAIRDNPFIASDSVTLYAKWVDPCTVNFDTNCGVEIQPITVPSDREYYFEVNGNWAHEMRIDGNNCIYRLSNNDPYFPVKSGATITGWYTDSDFNNSPLGDNNKFKAPANGTVTLYAKWSN